MPQRSVATVGGDYSGCDTAWAYLATIDPLVDDWEFIQTGDCTVNAWPDIGVAANRIDFNGHRVRFICPFSDSHQGDPTAGYMTFLNGANGIIDIRMAGAGGINDRFEAEGLNVEQQVSLFLNLFRVGNWVIGNVSSATYRNLMIKGANNGVGIQYACTTDYVRVSNIKAWNLSTALGTGPAGFIGGGPYNGRKYAEFITAYNCTGDGFGIYIHPEFDQEFRDCVAIDCVVNDFFFFD